MISNRHFKRLEYLAILTAKHRRKAIIQDGVLLVMFILFMGFAFYSFS